jgi:hypothetical protein
MYDHRPNTENLTNQRQRDRDVYQYLLTLTDLGDREQKLPKKQNQKEKKYSIASISMQWGTDRMFIKRILDNLGLQEHYSHQYSNLPGLDLDKLVNILSTLRSYWLLKQTKGRPVRRITRLEIVKAIRLFCQLSPDQESRLGFHTYQGKLLMQSLDDNINDLSQEMIPDAITKLYKYFTSIKIEYLDRRVCNDIDDYLRMVIKHELAYALNLKDDEVESKDVDKIHRKIKNEISKIETENGFDSFDYFNRSQSSTFDDYFHHESDTSHYLSRSAVQILTKSVIENEILTDEFPLYLKYVEVKKNRSLPLYLDNDDINRNESGVLNHEYHIEEEQSQGSEKESKIRIKSLKNLFSYTVKVHFYLRLPKSYTPDFDGKDRDLSIDGHPDGGLCVNFFEEITGVGSSLSHVVAAINRVLLWDIPLLKDYISIAKNIIIENQVLGSSPNSTIWGHNIVCLCKRDEVRAAIDKKEVYDRIFHTQECATGNYCGFDLLEVVGKAAFYARLRAIKQTGIDSKEYTRQVLNRIREVNAFRKAENLLNSYPFSLLAMEEYIEKSIFEDKKYRTTEKTQADIKFIEDNSNHWSMVAYESHLAIAEAYLKEGLYEVGRRYLDILQKHITRYEPYIDSLLLAKYYLSMFRYYYLTDRKGNNSQVQEMLKKSKHYLHRYTQKCFVIDELPQVNLHDFYYIFSRLCAHEAKIHIFMNRNVAYEDRYKELRNAIYAFEKSRIYAARQGNASLYSMWSAYQSWCYIMAAYLDNNKKKHYLKWASKLIDHALVCYCENGRKCYESIKANSGKFKEDETYIENASIAIQVIPFIQEIEIEDLKKMLEKPEFEYYQLDNNREMLTLDMSIFSWKYPANFGSGDNKNTYLFGIPSIIFLLVIGMMKLCQSYESNDKMLEQIKEAKKYFNYSWSIAEEGLEIDTKSSEKSETESARRNDSARKDNLKKFKRRFKGEPNSPKEFPVGGLYPHRMTQFADFGKMFAIVCDLIIAGSGNSEINVKEIGYLIGKINSSNFNDKEMKLNQEKYNIHFEEMCNHFADYVNSKEKEIIECGKVNLPNHVNETISIEEVRDKIVGDIFTIITTRSRVE